MEYSTTPKRFWLLGLFSLVGAGLGISLSQHYYSLRAGAGAFKSFCNFGGTVNCDVVTLSRYSEFIAGLPLSSFVAGWFAAFFIITLLARNAFWRRDALRALFLMAAVGTIFAFVYFFLQAAVIHAYCVLCLFTDFINVALLVLVWSLKPEGIREIKPDLPKWRIFVMIGAVCLAIAVFGLKTMEAERPGASLEDDIVNSVVQSPPVNVGDVNGLPSIGPENAPIQIVEFSDFQCPFCRVGAVGISNLANRYPGKVRVIFRNFPLNSECNKATQATMHPSACDAARAVICAHRQGKFQALYEALFENQTSLSPSSILQHAEKSGLDANALRTCMGSVEAQQALTLDTQQGEVLGIRSTPTFYVNGHKVEGAIPLSGWSKIVEFLLKK